MHRYCMKFGRVREIRLIRDRITQESRGFAFVDFFTLAEAQACLAHRDHLVDGRVPRLSYARGKDATGNGMGMRVRISEQDRFRLRSDTVRVVMAARLVF